LSSESPTTRKCAKRSAVSCPRGGEAAQRAPVLPLHLHVRENVTAYRRAVLRKQRSHKAADTHSGHSRHHCGGHPLSGGRLAGRPSLSESRDNARGLFQPGGAQLNLFDENAPRADSEALMTLMDKLNRQGRGTLYFAGQGIQQAWQMKREMLSPRYTTRWSDLPVVRAN